MEWVDLRDVVRLQYDYDKGSYAQRSYMVTCQSMTKCLKELRHLGTTKSGRGAFEQLPEGHREKTNKPHHFLILPPPLPPPATNTTTTILVLLIRFLGLQKQGKP